MNPKEIIESGILEEYVMGLLPDKKKEGADEICAETIAQMCLTHPEIAAEVEAIEAALLNTYAVPVNPEWKNEILASLDKESQDDVGNEGGGRVIDITSSSIAQSQGTKSRTWFWAAAAFAGLFVISGVTNFILLHKNNSLSDELAQTRTELKNETDEKSVFAASYKQSQQDYQQLFNPDIQRVVMQGTPDFAGKLSVVYWNPNSGEVLWDASSLPQLGADEQYQLWAIVDGKPQNAGVMTSDKPLKMLNATSAQAFAVTVEPKGGSEIPTLDKMVVVAPVASNAS